MKEIKLKTKVILAGEENFFGPGICQLLLNIDDTGSIQGAAARMQMSYSKSWKIIKRAEEQTGIRFVNRMSGGKHGGRSELTEEGREFLKNYQALEQEIREAGALLMKKYFR